MKDLSSLLTLYLGTALLGKVLGDKKVNVETLDNFINRKDYPFPMYRLTLNGQELYVVGVLHSWIHSNIGRYESFISALKELIGKDSISYVVLEGPEYIYNQKGLLDDVLRGISILTGGVIYPLNAMGFFWDIENILKEKNKKLVVIDPITLHGFYMYLTLVGAITLYVRYKIREGIVSRRDFIELLPFLSFLIGANIKNIVGIGEIPNILDAMITSEYHGLPRPLSEPGIQDKITFLDYIIDGRNVFLAEGIEVFTRYLKEKEGSGHKIVVIHGASHNGLILYLENKDLRELKKKVYSIYELLYIRKIRMYNYNKDSKEWNLEKEIEY